MRRRRKRPRWLRLLRWTVLLLLVSWLPVALFAVLPVPESAFTLAYRIGGLTDARPPLRQQWLSTERMPEAIRLAVIAAEDQRFAMHPGFDVAAIRAAIAHNEKGGTVRGASTITQQTAKNLFLWSGRSWLRKGLETWYTLLLELTWSKQRILTVYLNIAEFGEGVYGVQAAAQQHFRKPAEALTRHEAALLAAVLPSPVRYSASRPSPYVRERAAWIERQMRQLGPDALP